MAISFKLDNSVGMFVQTVKIAELARTLTMLLNDWLQIPPARLTVHYTPFLGGLADESETKSMS